MFAPPSFDYPGGRGGAPSLERVILATAAVDTFFLPHYKL
jgi:hypothetical protein